ncbi:MAG: enoyl-CoA hydratase family protein [Caldimonas sp.]
MPSELLSERRGQTLVLTICDPATRNTLSAQVIAAGIEALGVSESDPDVRAVVLQGDGAHFCAGGNLKGLAERRAAGRDVQRRMVEHLHQWVEAIRAYPKPVIAAVEGAAAGAGFSIALACDLIVAAEDASFVMSYGKAGLTPDAGASWSLVNALPRAYAQRLLWLAEPVSAAKLLVLGLVTEVTPPGQALAQALRLAERLAEMASNAVAAAKELVEQASRQSLAAQLDAERDHLVASLFDANGGEGLEAFFAKRPPRFR